MSFPSSPDAHSLSREGFPCHECPVPTGREFYKSGLFSHKLKKALESAIPTFL